MFFLQLKVVSSACADAQRSASRRPAFFDVTGLLEFMFHDHHYKQWRGRNAKSVMMESHHPGLYWAHVGIWSEKT
jgi:hypothetical protein